MLWNRQYRVKFPGIGLEFANTLRISFDITKDLSKNTNKGKLTIWNLSDETRHKINVPDTKVEIYAGYKDNGGAVRIFVGSVISAQTKDDGKDVTTELTLSDGQMAIRDTAFSLSFAPGTPGNTIIQYIADEMGLPLVWGDGVQFGTFNDGFSFIGMAADALDAICYGSGVKWSVQNEILQLIKEGGTVSNKGLVFAPDSGLIGSPEWYTKANSQPNTATPKRKRKQAENTDSSTASSGWKVKTLLSPTLNPGDLVKVESRYVEGWFKVKSAHHTGDTYGNEWNSELDLVDRNATLQSPESDAASNTAVYGNGGTSGEVSANVDAGCEAVADNQGGYIPDGCVYRVTEAGSYYSPFLKQEYDNGQWGVDGLCADAGDNCIPYDAGKLEKGDVIVFYNDDHSEGHVGIYDGNGGMWHNSYNHQSWYHAGDTDMGDQYPQYIIKASQC